MYISRVKIDNFRTLDDFEVVLDKSLQIIVGANNIGKTNFLRALNLFFNSEVDDGNGYRREVDMTYFKRAITGSPVQPSIEVDLLVDDELIQKYNIKEYIFADDNKKYLRTKCIYQNEGILWIYSDNKGKFPTKNNYETNQITNGSEISKLFRRIKFIYIPAQINLEDKINFIIRDEVLPIMADTYQTSGDIKGQLKLILDKVSELDQLISNFFKEKNFELTTEINDILKDFPEIIGGEGIENFTLELGLGEDTLIEILKKRIIFNVQDGSGESVEMKGSGIQKLLLLTLLKYIGKKNDEKQRYHKPYIIWGIDEPESFMQPKLQNKVREMFYEISKDFQIITTTHSPRFVDISNLGNVKLFYLETTKVEKDKSKGSRKTGVFYKKVTKWTDNSTSGFIEKIKEHFGIQKNDGWILTDKNLLFEGFDDTIYFNANYNFFFQKNHGYSTFSCESSANMPSFVEFLNQQISNESLGESAIRCLLDNDEAGRDANTKILKYTGTDKEKRFIKTFLIKSTYLNINDNGNEAYPKMIEDFLISEVYFEAVINKLTEKVEKNKGEIAELSKYNFIDFEKERKKMKKHTISEVLNTYFVDVLDGEDFFSFLGVKASIAKKYEDLLALITGKERGKYLEKYKNISEFYKEFTK